MKNHVELGYYCESLGATFLTEKGYQLLERNYRTRRGEIDLIFIDGDFLVFVEVKHSGRVGIESLFNQIGHRKRYKIISVAKEYLFLYPKYQKLLIRFDVLGIDADTNKVTHFENAFEENALL